MTQKVQRMKQFSYRSDRICRKKISVSQLKYIYPSLMRRCTNETIVQNKVGTKELWCRCNDHLPSLESGLCHQAGMTIHEVLMGFTPSIWDLPAITGQMALLSTALQWCSSLSINTKFDYKAFLICHVKVMLRRENKVTSSLPFWRWYSR